MNEKKRKKILIIFAVAFILIISWVIYIVISEINKYEFVSVYDLTDLDSVLEYYEINLISRQDDTSNDKNKEYEIYLYVNYPYNTYTDNKTNEAFFMESSEQIARVCGYKNILVVDESKALKVGIKSVNGAFNKIIVNEDENYYSVNAQIPILNINNDQAKQINAEIKTLFYDQANSIMRRNEGKTIYTVSYASFVNGNVLSMVIKSTLKEEGKSEKVSVKTYNYSILEHKMISLDNLIKEKGKTNEEIQNIINEDIKKAYNNAEIIADQYGTLYQRDLSSDIYKLENAENYFLTQDGYVYIIYAYGNNDYTNEMDIIIF